MAELYKLQIFSDLLELYVKHILYMRSNKDLFKKNIMLQVVDNMISDECYELFSKRHGNLLAK